MRFISLLIFFCITCFVGVSFAEEISVRDAPYVCGDDKITGQIITNDLEHTTLTMILSQSGVSLYSFTGLIRADGSYTIPLSYEEITPGMYTIVAIAQLGELKEIWTYDTRIDIDCPVIPTVITPEKDLFRETLVDLANEVLFLHQRAVDHLPLPKEFLPTGGPFKFFLRTYERLGARLAFTEEPIYDDLPPWTLAPTSTYPKLTFADRYATLPADARSAKAYLRFKGLFVPIQLAGPSLTDGAVMDLLTHGMVLAPQTPSLDLLGPTKMLYAHAASFVPGPFAGIGSYLSLFGHIGDEVVISTRDKDGHYSDRTYIVSSIQEVLPTQTSVLDTFRGLGADTFTIITCRQGDVLGSTEARQLIHLTRREDELSTFQIAERNIREKEFLHAMKHRIDRYVATHQFDEQKTTTLVKKLDMIEQKHQGSILALIATYAKYMIAYDAIYIDQVLK